MLALALKKALIRRARSLPETPTNIFAYIKASSQPLPGLVQLQDKIVVRCALTIYPYSLATYL